MYLVYNLYIRFVICIICMKWIYSKIGYICYYNYMKLYFYNLNLYYVYIMIMLFCIFKNEEYD